MIEKVRAVRDERVVKMVADPRLPSQKEVEEHRGRSKANHKVITTYGTSCTLAMTGPAFGCTRIGATIGWITVNAHVRSWYNRHQAAAVAQDMGRGTRASKKPGKRRT